MRQRSWVRVFRFERVSAPDIFGAGEYHIPLWADHGEYLTILKDAKQAFDPANLMHPDVLPTTEV
jgi:FAD/FMN-containing dehydrogenase